MDDPNDASADAEAADANSMAYAAAEAAAAAEAQEDLATRTCRICGKGGEDGRAMIHFPPMDIDMTVAQVAPNVTTFTEDLALHVFCGKTASILPNVNMPQYEILSKAGIKNKHGIGTEVNTALARTRVATVTQTGAKEKQFYIVQEFEANLSAVRMASGTHHVYQQQPQLPEIAIPPHPHHLYAQPPLPEQQYHHPAETLQAAHIQQMKPAPARAAAGAIHKPGRRREEAWAYAPQSESNMTSDGKIKCACGGTHLPTGTAKGAASWRSHVMTKRHQKWMEENGLLGAV